MKPLGASACIRNTIGSKKPPGFKKPYSGVRLQKPLGAAALYPQHNWIVVMAEIAAAVLRNQLHC